MLVQKLSDAGGIEIEGVDLSKSLAADVEREIARLYDEEGLLAFRDQRLTKRQLVDATAAFGGPDLHPAVDDCDPEAPGISVISTRGALGDVVPEDQDALVGDIDWHTDQAYITTPNRGKLLYAVEVPQKGGMTGFIDGQRTYEALPAAIKAQIDGLHVAQSWRFAQETIARNRDYRIEGETVLAIERFPDIAYPLAVPHPHSGRKSLNVPPLWAAGVVELPGAKGRALLDELIAHIRQPQFAYWHAYRPGDVVAWDNWRFLHAAGGTEGRYARTMWSVVIRGGPEFGYALDARAPEAAVG